FDIVTSTLPVEYVPRALVEGERLGLFKLVAEAGTNRLLGATIVAEGGRRRDPRRALCDQVRANARTDHEHVGAVPDDGRRPQTRSPGTRPRRRTPPVLRRMR